MWIDKTVIPFLSKALAHYLDATVDSDAIDPNDWVIFANFVLPVLQDNQDKGFVSEVMLEKGFRFLVDLIPYFLQTAEQTCEEALEGRLLKIYISQKLAEIADYTEIVPDAYVHENLASIVAKLADVKRVLSGSTKQ